MSIFNELKNSLNEAIEIEQGKTEPGNVTEFKVADVSAIRSQLNVSQKAFADALGTSVDTIKSWESKRRNPTGIAAKVLASIQDDPSIFKTLASH
ncbi:NadS family protein [Reinekea blandensis]|uniref:HTH cro/C1-type domain-containing protein n=1 Tax=Reinekea blandensis MED297 TaxID=314283 RepID=A4BJW4_9GAMM|nr:NadS family protein [Reinekea blandensis]EAR07565.1 hypothetical protein MED297_00050 [Reinekea sp. MED297] [Reinekea blandensis MED297]